MSGLIPMPVVRRSQVAPRIFAAHTAWVKGSKEIELKTLFAQQAEQELLHTTRDFHSCKQEEGQSDSSYVLKMKGYIDNLEHLGHPVTLGLALHEQTLDSAQKQTLLLQAAIRAGKSQKGHWKRNCPQYLAELLKKKKNAASEPGGSGVSSVIALNALFP
ncbi:hypothetical protein Tco_0424449 [Tanacetum coccineum]